MPYIPDPQRDVLYPELEKLAAKIRELEPNDWEGCLNYSICMLADILAGTRYSLLQKAGGAIHYADLEFYRRVTALYEDLKCKKTGDVFRNDRGL